MNSGKPIIKNLPFHFNISHTENSIAICIGPKPMGVDIEMIRNTTLFEPVAVSQYHPNERTLVLANDNDITFLSIWTRKEALLKAVGTGLNDELAKYDCTMEYQTVDDQRYSLVTYQCEDTIISFSRQESSCSRKFRCCLIKKLDQLTIHNRLKHLRTTYLYNVK